MIIPGILEQTLKDYEEKIRILDKKCELIQIDIVDGILTEGKSFLDTEKITQISHKTPFEIHLMVQNPLKVIPFNKGRINGVNKICTQVTTETSKLIFSLKKLGYKTGLSLNINEEIDLIKDLINSIDYVQFMSVTPGNQGNPFYSPVLDKIKKFKTNYPNVETQIDGGINDQNFNDVIKSGVDNIVIGSAIFNSQDPVLKLRDFQKLFNAISA